MRPSSRTVRPRYSRRVDDAAVIAALRARDERVFAELMRMYNASLLRVALIYVATRAVAEDVVQETWIGVLNGIDRLPPAQRAVISLRDIEGWSSEEARNALGISETNQRVLLHRARSKVRQALEDYLVEAR